MTFGSDSSDCIENLKCFLLPNVPLIGNAWPVHPYSSIPFWYEHTKMKNFHQNISTCYVCWVQHQLPSKYWCDVVCNIDSYHSVQRHTTPRPRKVSSAHIARTCVNVVLVSSSPWPLQFRPAVLAPRWSPSMAIRVDPRECGLHSDEFLHGRVTLGSKLDP